MKGFRGGRFLGWTGLAAGGFLSLTGPLAPRVVVAQWGHSVARVQKVQRVRPAFGRLVQRVAVAADAAGCIEGLCIASLRGRRPFGLRVADCPLGQ